MNEYLERYRCALCVDTIWSVRLNIFSLFWFNLIIVKSSAIDFLFWWSHPIVCRRISSFVTCYTFAHLASQPTATTKANSWKLIILIACHFNNFIYVENIIQAAWRYYGFLFNQIRLWKASVKLQKLLSLQWHHHQ